MSQLRDVIFLSQAWAEAMIPDGSESIVSITDTQAPPANLNEGWHALLRIRFDDADPDEFPGSEFEAGLIPIFSSQAKEISDFVHSISDHSETLVVHCKYGQSRSPGVAKAICQHFGLEFPPEFKSQNNFVCRLVLNAISQRGGA
jgi:predicted protein tyrosine phosphatase